MKHLTLVLIISISQYLVADEDADYQEYLQGLALYEQVMHWVFDCGSTFSDIEFRYTEDYRKSNLEHYFNFSPENFCFIEAEELSIHDQTFLAYENGIRSSDEIFDSLTYSQYEITTDDCAGLEQQYRAFYEVVGTSINYLGETNIAVLKTEPNEDEEEALEEIVIRLHPPMYDFYFGDYEQPRFQITVAGSDNSLVEWAYETKEIADSCSNR